MFEEILPKATIDTILSLKPLLDTLYLAGGTGLALQLGHRNSEDLDFVSDQPFNTDAIVAAIKPDKILYTSLGTVHCEINNIPISFLYNNPPLTHPILVWNNVRIAHLDDITAEKIKTICRRGSKKDFIDLFAVLQTKYTVKEVCDRFKKRFKELEMRGNQELFRKPYRSFRKSVGVVGGWILGKLPH